MLQRGYLGQVASSETVSTESVGVGRTFSSVCLFVRSITQKRMIPKVFKFGIGNA